MAQASSTCMKLRRDRPPTALRPVCMIEGNHDDKETLLVTAGLPGGAVRGRPRRCP